MKAGGAPRLLVLGGLDPCGGAGITADAIVAAQHGVLALPIAVALTTQNRHGFREVIDVPVSQWRRALAAALADGDVHAVKTGMLGSAEAIEAAADSLLSLHRRVPIVVDPVLSATAGGHQPGAAVAAVLRTRLASLADVVTPNLPELEALGGAGSLFAAGCAAVACKGGHGDGEFAVDELLRPGANAMRWRRRRLPVGPVHGTGCAFATSLASRLACGEPLTDAVRNAGDWLWDRLAMLGPPDADGLPRPLVLAPADVSRTSPR